MRHVFCIVLLMMIAAVGYGQALLLADTNRARNALHYPELALAHWEVRLGYLDSSLVTEQQFQDNLGVGLRIAGPHQYPVTITQFSLFIFPKGSDYINKIIKRNKIPAEDMIWLRRCRKNDRLFIENIKVKEGNNIVAVPSLAITIR